MRSYEAARTLFSFLGFIAWSVIIIGILVSLVSAGSVSQYAGGGAGLLAMVPGFGIAIGGFILLAFVQMGRAGVDTAEYTQQMLKISRDQLEVSRQALKGEGHQPKRFETIKKPEPSGAGFERTDFGSVENSNAEKDVKTVEDFTPKTNEFGFSILNEQGTLMEYRGRKFEFIDGKYNMAGQSWSSGKLLKRHLNQLKVIES